MKIEKISTKGFIQIPILISIVLGTLLIGSVGYIGITKYDNSKKETENKQEVQKILDEARNLKIENNQKEVKVSNETTQAQDTKKVIEKTIAEQKAVNIPVSTETQETISNITDTKKSEKTAFDNFWQNIEKTISELNSATKYITDALNNSSKELAIIYAQNAVDSCNSAYQLNLNNQVPILPFSNDLKEVSSFVSDLSVRCKQMAQTYKASFEHSIYNNFTDLNKAKELAIEADKLMEEYFDFWNKKFLVKSELIIKIKNEYFDL